MQIVEKFLIRADQEFLDNLHGKWSLMQPRLQVLPNMYHRTFLGIRMQLIY
jgi:hypothetical protein